MAVYIVGNPAPPPGPGPGPGPGVIFAPDIGLEPTGNVRRGPVWADFSHGDNDPFGQVQTSVVRPGGQAKAIAISYIHDESQLTLSPPRFAPTKTLYVRRWERFSTNWGNNWPVGLKTSRWFTDGIAYLSEKFVWQRYPHDGGSRNDPVWGITNASVSDDQTVAYTTSTRPRVDTWHKMETFMEMNTALNIPNGRVRMWLDDLLVFDRPNAFVKDASPTGIEGWTSGWFGGNCSYSEAHAPAGGWAFPAGLTLMRYIDSPYLSTTLDR